MSSDVEDVFGKGQSTHQTQQMIKMLRQKYVDQKISEKFGSINDMLDQINGEIA